MTFDSSRAAGPRADQPESVHRPLFCPFCQSKSVGTHAKEITISTYWRCQACGEIWNPMRLELTQHRNRRW